MNRYIYIFLFICLFTIITFVLFESFGLSFDSVLQNTSSKVTAATISVLLLGVDVVLPIPSSIVMISNGVLFGVWAGGFLSVAGGLLSAVVGYFIGARSKRLAEKFSGSSDATAARTFLEKYGYMAVIVSRPIPVLAESVAIISGTSQLDFKKVVLGSLIGLVPICFVYSITGAYSTGFDSGVWALGLNMGVAALVWVLTRPRQKPKSL
jgi:uncharacterized membrane protein YdjX (TVP38/TMEM64 family)